MASEIVVFTVDSEFDQIYWQGYLISPVCVGQITDGSD